MTSKFINKLYICDNLKVLTGLNSESVDLVYLDPPFNSKRLYNAPIGSRAEGSQFKDTWKWSDVNEFPIDLFDIDHIVPKACGGGDYLENYQLLCRTCNTTKGAIPMAFLLQRIDLIRKFRREIEY